MLTTLYMPEDEFAHVYDLIKNEDPVFFTAVKFQQNAWATVHTELDLSAGEPPGEGNEDHSSLEALIRLARRQESGPIAEARGQERQEEAPPENT